MKAAIAVALVAVAGCSAATPAEPVAADPPPRPPLAAKQSDTLSRADQIAAEAAKREAEYQQSLEGAKKPKTEVPVVTEFSPQAAAIPAYASGGSAPRPEESWWRAQMDPLRQAWAENDLAFRDANARWRASDKMKGGPEKDAARSKAIADQQRATAVGDRIRAQAFQLIEKARQMNVPQEWVKWP
jgi:hypothetical protein